MAVPVVDAPHITTVTAWPAADRRPAVAELVRSAVTVADVRRGIPWGGGSRRAAHAGEARAACAGIRHLVVEPLPGRARDDLLGAMRQEDLPVLALSDAAADGAVHWELVGPMVGGVQSGAWRLRSGDRAAVLKLAPTARWAEQVARAERSVGRVRAAGYPTPAWITVGRLDGWGYQIHELVQGATREHVGVTEASQLVHVLERQAGLDPDPDRCWSDHLDRELTTGLSALREQAARAAPDGAGSALVVACDRLWSGPGPPRLPRTDMVHGDFRPANVLFDGGSVSGVVDIEAIGSGSRVFDYATLIDHAALADGALELLVAAAVEVAGPRALRACFALVVLDLVRFMHGSPAVEEGHVRERVCRLTERVEAVDRLSRR